MASFGATKSTTTVSDLSCIDTNVLVYAYFEGARHHAASRAFLERARLSDAGYCVTSQTLAEFYATVTNPRRVSDAKEPEVALKAIGELLALPGIHVLPTPTDVVETWVRLLRRRPVTAGDIFDLQLIAIMVGNGVHRIYTYNRDDFLPFDEIKVLEPPAP